MNYATAPTSGAYYSPPFYTPPMYNPPAQNSGETPPAPEFESPIPLLPIVIPGASEGALAAEETTFIIRKLTALPLLFLIPVFVISLVGMSIFAYGTVSNGGLAAKLLEKEKKKQNKKNPHRPEPTLETPPPVIEQPYWFYEQRTSSSDSSERTTREAKQSSGLPALSLAQVERLTSIVFAALRSQECVQRLLCEAGSLSRSYSTAQIVARAVGRFVPESLRSSYDIFVRGDQCEQYVCGNLLVKK